MSSLSSPPRGCEHETDLWHTGTRSHWGGQCIWLHWGTACWNSRLCQSDTRLRWTLGGTDTDGITGRSSPRQLLCQELPISKPSNPPKHKLSKSTFNGIIKHTHHALVLVQPTFQRFCLPGQRSLSLTTEMAKSNRNKADGAQVVSTTGQLCLPVKLRARQ